MFDIYSTYYGYIGSVNARSKQEALTVYKAYQSHDSRLQTMDIGGIYAMRAME